MHVLTVSGGGDVAFFYRLSPCFKQAWTPSLSFYCLILLSCIDTEQMRDMIKVIKNVK